MGDYTTPLPQLLAEMGANPNIGLSQPEAERRLSQDGSNTLQVKPHKTAFQKFLLQLKDGMVIILIVAAVISFLVALSEPEGHFIDSIIILAIVVLNAVLGVVQESKAEHALDALQDMSAPTARVLRDEIVQELPAANLVRGDIVLLEAGDFVPADLRLLETASLKCEESALTGESLPADKDASAHPIRSAPLGDRVNMAYSGCAVAYGRGVGVVTATGMRSEMGKIADLLSEGGNETTPLQQRLSVLSKYLGLIAIAICAVIFLLGLFQGMPVMELFMTAVSLAVAAIPEGLTAVITVVLALGVQRMVQKNAIIRRLPAVETLGSASVICSDKTGTLTQNRMTVQQVWAVGQQIEEPGGECSGSALQILRLGALCNDGRIETVDGEEKHIGDPTETAIVAAAAVVGLFKSDLDREFPRLAELPFDSDRKRMTTVHKVGGTFLAVVKGGLDSILPLCIDDVQSRALAINDQMGSRALRVLAVACRELDALPTPEEMQSLESNLRFMGLIGMIDPPREESKQAVALCRDAGIRTVMITGDHLVTAGAIARELGILEEDGKSLSGAELQQMSQEELERDVASISVYARVSPEDKIRIVKAWQARGAVVAMTGDGVNDAPALHAADIGCAMGITGTDVAKGAADMVLTDDNFSTIVEAVREGRGIYSNMKKSIQFLLGCNLGEVLAVFFSMLLGWGSPLLAIHLLTVNIVTDALPALALGVEPVDTDIMKRRPVPREQGLFADGMGIIILLQGIMVGFLTLAAYYIGAYTLLSPLFPPSRDAGMTMAFLVLAFTQLSQALNCRSTQPLTQIGFFNNQTMNRALLVSGSFLLAVTLIPPLERLFRLVDLSMMHWIVLLCLSVAPLIITEIVKGFLHLRQKRRRAIS